MDFTILTVLDILEIGWVWFISMIGLCLLNLPLASVSGVLDLNLNIKEIGLPADLPY